MLCQGSAGLSRTQSSSPIVWHLHVNVPLAQDVVVGLQFGKVDSYTYIMDYNPAEITALQAFAVSLSTFDTKLLL